MLESVNMRKFLKWFEIIAGGLLGIALILVVVFFSLVLGR